MTITPTDPTGFLRIQNLSKRFDSVLAVDDLALLQMAVVASLTVLTLAALLRPLVLETLDAGFLRSVGGPGAIAHVVLLVLLVANLVSAFQAMGTLMAVGLMMLPAAAAPFWVARVLPMCVLPVAIGALSGVAGLWMSFVAELPSGPSIVLAAGMVYLVSVLAGSRDGIVWRRWRRNVHRAA